MSARKTMNANELEARRRSPELFAQTFDNPKKRRKARSPAQRAATAKLVALNKARTGGKHAPARRNPTARQRIDKGNAHESNPAQSVHRGLGYAVLSGARLHSIWPMRADAVEVGRSLANSIGSPIRVAAIAYTWTQD